MNSCQTESGLQTLGSDCHIPPPPPHLGIPIVPRRLPVPDDPPRWNENSAQVTSGQQLLPLLDYRRHGLEVTKYEAFAKSSRDVCHRWAPWHRTSSSCSTLGKDTTYVVVPTPTSSTPLFWGTQIPCLLAMWALRKDAATITPHVVQITLVFFRSLKVPPSPVARLL